MRLLLLYILLRYYGVSSLMVDWTSMMFMLLYVIFVIPVQYMSDKCGLRWTAILGSGLICLGSWIKIFSIHPDNFYIVFIGQSIVGFSQVILLISLENLYICVISSFFSCYFTYIIHILYHVFF